MILWHTLSTYFRARFGVRVQKIPLDAGASCPNRDGTLSSTGCIFCNAQGSGSGLLGRGIDIGAQWDFWQGKYRDTDNRREFLAYFQSFSNTYGPVSQLRRLLDQVALLPGNRGLAIGTRPDCLNAEKCDLLAACPLPEVWLELGLQSVHDATLARIGRHHTRADAEASIYMATERGIKVCGHLMAGLPGEDTEAFLESVRWAASLPLAGIKLHSLYVCRDSALERIWAKGDYTPLTRDAYVDALARALPLLPSRMVVHRLTGDPAPGELLAPLWTLRKRDIFTALHHRLRSDNAWQGSQSDVPLARPEWYGR